MLSAAVGRWMNGFLRGKCLSNGVNTSENKTNNFYSCVEMNLNVEPTHYLLVILSSYRRQIT